MGQGGWERLRDGWRSTGAGLLTFAMSGLLGFVLMYRSPVPPDAAFQNLMPAFIGLFTVPWLLLNIVTRVSPPPQRVGLAEPLGAGQAAWGVASGCAGGAFAAFVPAVTGGVGAMLAGHAAPSRDSRVFLVSQGASRVFYYAGGFLLFFVPGPRLTRGGAAWLMRGIHEPGSFPDYCVALASAAVAGAVCVALAGPMAAGAIRLVERHGYRRVSWVSLALVCACVACLTGPGGAAVAAVATGIGLIPVLFGSRRMNCLGVILLPVACNMSGVGPTVAGWLGLL
jgi:putative membrane protein